MAKKKSPAVIPAPVKRGPGRPRKNPLPVAQQEALAAPRKRGRPRKIQIQQPLVEAAPKRGRGRPRKHPVVALPPPPAPRKRGRPRKHPLQPVQVIVSSAPRKRGRPPKIKAVEQPQPAVVARKRGRPRKNPQTAALPPVIDRRLAGEEKTRRPGRPKLAATPARDGADLNRIRLVELKNALESELGELDRSLDDVLDKIRQDFMGKIHALKSSVAEGVNSADEPWSLHLSATVEKIARRLAVFRSTKHKDLEELSKLSDRLDKAYRKTRR